jgi:hypothetical protein
MSSPSFAPAPVRLLPLALASAARSRWILSAKSPPRTAAIALFRRGARNVLADPAPASLTSNTVLRRAGSEDGDCALGLALEREADRDDGGTRVKRARS